MHLVLFRANWLDMIIAFADARIWNGLFVLVTDQCVIFILDTGSLPFSIGLWRDVSWPRWVWPRGLFQCLRIRMFTWRMYLYTQYVVLTWL